MHKYAYSSPTDGTYFIDDKVFSIGEDFRTSARYAEYKNVGLDTLLLQGNDPYLGEDWETSQTKKNMDEAAKAGLSRIVVFDKRIHDLSAASNGLIGSGKPFKDEESLASYLKECLKDYSKHPSFVGVMLVDEPSYECFDSIGQVERCLKKLIPDVYIQCNLLPVYGDAKRLSPKDGISKSEAYRDYLEAFCLKTPHEVLTMDSYPIRREICGDFIINNHFTSYQMIADVAKKYGRKSAFVLQSTAMLVDGKDKFRPINGRTLEYQYGAALCFVPSEISYFTYWAKQKNLSKGESFPNGTSFVSREGKRTPLYEAAKAMHSSYEEIETILEPYSYCSSKVINSPLKGDCLDEEVDIGVTTSAPLLITKLVNGSSNVYCLMNLNDPDELDITEEALIRLPQPAMTIRLLSRNGEETLLNAQTLKVSLTSGRPLFLEIKNENNA